MKILQDNVIIETWMDFEENLIFNHMNSNNNITTKDNVIEQHQNIQLKVASSQHTSKIWTTPKATWCVFPYQEIL